MVLDVICNKFYFGEVREEVLGQCSKWAGYISQHLEQKGLSVYQCSVPEKNKQGG